MIFITPNAELWNQPDYNNSWKEHVVRCAKVCYKSEKEVDVDKFIDARLRAGHYSILRHATAYFKIPLEEVPKHIINVYIGTPGFYTCHNTIWLFIAINYQLIVENPSLYDLLRKYQIDILEASNTIEIWENIFRYTFCIITQISTSRELNRVSPNNILEESTRYVEQGIVCRPWWLRSSIIQDGDMVYDLTICDTYEKAVDKAFENYFKLLELGVPKQDARGVLPLDTATRCVYTYTIGEWRDIIAKRFYGVTGKPHPNAREVVQIIRDILMEEGYDFRDYCNR